ncbi:segregation/condensation protein A [Paraflavitalea sp. CAU 1676]|uniref:segregation and condensation protein A n=1 Tax=Paraflavitalea sp. CAU 1676 TaxID=3032598 RepID=UPI0023D9C127|nr:segregation/condensation protein A [Paraflavitalea sp. CAU 1676]MDF2187110.1 segregation/condensation protein A [Paraflavitalea sp. CAU 1676]
MNQSSYQIKLPQFEGPFDLLLFFIERDELDIYNIPITKIIKDFMDYIHGGQALNIELSSEFILFVSTLMRIKAKMLLPRKELDAQGNEIDPRQELVDKILEYKRFKEASVRMAEMEAIRMLMVRRGNLQKELSTIGEESGEGTEIQTITLFKLMKTFEKVMKKLEQRNKKPVHTVVRYNYTMEGSREYMLSQVKKEKVMSFEKVFTICEDRIHAIFLFLSMLELVQMRYMSLMVGEGRNNFLLEFNEHREEDPIFDARTLGMEPPADGAPLVGLFASEAANDQEATIEDEDADQPSEDSGAVEDQQDDSEGDSDDSASAEGDSDENAPRS